jgi:hypothetical protein
MKSVELRVRSRATALLPTPPLKLLFTSQTLHGSLGRVTCLSWGRPIVDHGFKLVLSAPKTIDIEPGVVFKDQCLFKLQNILLLPATPLGQMIARPECGQRAHDSRQFAKPLINALDLAVAVAGR